MSIIHPPIKKPADYVILNVNYKRSDDGKTRIPYPFKAALPWAVIHPDGSLIFEATHKDAIERVNNDILRRKFTVKRIHLDSLHGFKAEIS